jgi:hypothetical protein
MNVQVQISNDPVTGLKRVTTVKEFYVNLTSVTLATETKSFDANDVEVVTKSIKPFNVNLVAVNSTLVNPANGNTVEDGEDAEDCTMGEYDYLVAVADNPINIFDVMRATILKSDSRGRFN